MEVQKQEKKKRNYLGSGECTKNLVQCVPEFLQVGSTLSWISMFALIGSDGCTLYCMN